MGEYRLCCNAGIGEECLHLVCLVPLGNISYPDAVERVIGCLKRNVLCALAETYAANKDIRGDDGMCQLCHNLTAGICQAHCHIGGISRHWYEEDILERARRGMGFRIAQPFLKERTE